MTTTPRRHKTTEVICKNCHNSFQSLDTRLKEGRGEFCSKKCYQEYIRQDNVRRNSISSLGKENAVKAFDKTKNSYYVYWVDPETLKRKTSSYPRWWWETNVGELGDGMVVGYKDGDSTNIDPSNFFVQSRKSSMKSLFTKLTGRKLSDETKKKLHDKHSGKTLSDEHRRKIGKSVVSRWKNGEFNTIHVGEYNSHWRGGVFDAYSKEFNDKLKELIRQRDGYRCQSCGKELPFGSNRTGNIHHIDVDRKNNDPNNLILLCTKCHGLVHKSSGSASDTELILILRTFIPQKP